MRLAILCLLGAVGCGGDDGPGTTKDAATGDSNKPIDAALVDARVVDAPPDAQQFVNTVTCPSGSVPTITTENGEFSFMPSSVTIAQNGIVKFVMSSFHNVRPDSTNSDPGIFVNSNETKCLQFTTTGTFGFHCGPHGFLGSVVVQ